MPDWATLPSSANAQPLSSILANSKVKWPHGTTPTAPCRSSRLCRVSPASSLSLETGPIPRLSRATRSTSTCSRHGKEEIQKRCSFTRIGWDYPWTFADRVHNHVVVSLGNDANESVLVSGHEKIHHPRLS